MSDELKEIRVPGISKVYIGFDLAATGGDRTVFTLHRRPLRVGDLAELLGQYEWSSQLNVLEYMRQFATWDQLYDDLEKRQRASMAAETRNVTPEKPKQLRENNG